MSTELRAGFSLIETMVAILVGTLLVVSVGILGGSLIHHRANSDSTSAATSVAQAMLERIRAEGNLNPDAAACAPCAANEVPPGCPVLCPGFEHGPFSVDERLAQTVGGPYRLAWTVTDGQPAVLSDVASKRIVVEVTHDHNPTVASRLETFLQASTVAAVSTTPVATTTPGATPTSPPAPTPTPKPGGGPGGGGPPGRNP